MNFRNKVECRVIGLAEDAKYYDVRPQSTTDRLFAVVDEASRQFMGDGVFDPLSDEATGSCRISPDAFRDCSDRSPGDFCNPT